jgi:hypothetical protein
VSPDCAVLLFLYSDMTGGIEIAMTQTLRNFDGQGGFSLAQGE